MKYFVILGSIFLASCMGVSEEKSIEELDAEFNTAIETIAEPVDSVIEASSDVYSVKTQFTPEHGWGYQILNNGDLYINQPHIPAVAGNKGFDSKDNAIKTAEYIVFKLENDMFPPTISPQELDSLGVI